MEAAGGALQRVAQVRRLRRRTAVRRRGRARSARPELSSCGRPGRRRRRHHDRPARRRRTRTSSSRRSSAPGTIADAVRFAAPGSFGRKPQEMRIGGNGHAQAGRERVHHVIAADAGQIERFGARGRHSPGARAKNRWRCAVRQQREERRRAAHPCRARRAAARGSPAGRDSRPAAPRSGAPARRGLAAPSPRRRESGSTTRRRRVRG